MEKGTMIEFYADNSVEVLKRAIALGGLPLDKLDEKSDKFCWKTNRELLEMASRSGSRDKCFYYLNPKNEADREKIDCLLGYKHSYSWNANKQVAYDGLFRQLSEWVKEFGFDGLVKVRVAVWDNWEESADYWDEPYDSKAEKIESVTFRLADNGQLGVFANWASLPNITTEMWGVWSKLNALLVKEVA